MSLNDHRRRAEGYRVKMHRMPKPDQVKLGTRIHEEDILDESIPEVDKCEVCEHFTEMEDLEQCWIEEATEYFGHYICFSCRGKAREYKKEK